MFPAAFYCPIPPDQNPSSPQNSPNYASYNPPSTYNYELLYRPIDGNIHVRLEEAELPLGRGGERRRRALQDYSLPSFDELISQAGSAPSFDKSRSMNVIKPVVTRKS